VPAIDQLSIEGARSTSSRKIAAQASQTIIDQISIVSPEFMRFFQHNAGFGLGKRSLISMKCQWLKCCGRRKSAALLPQVTAI
jgi:hypothetical protein